MVDIATIGLAVDTTDLRDGGAEMDRFAAKGEAMERRITSATAGTTAGLDKAGTAAAGIGQRMGMGSHGLRMFSMQLSQVGQQGAVTGNYLQALTVQLPDMLLAFGTAGALIGTVAAVTLPSLISALGSSRDRSKELEEQLEELAAAVDAFTSASDAAGASAADLRDTYGELAAEAKAALDAIADVRRVEAIEAINDAMRDFANTFGSLSTTENVGGGSDYEETLRRIRRELDLTGSEALTVVDALTRMENAEGLDAQAAAAAEARETLLAVFGTVQAMPPEIRNIYEAMASVTVEAATVQGAVEDADSAQEQFNQKLAGAYGLYQDLRMQAQGLTADIQKNAEAALALMKTEFGFQGTSMARYGGRGTTSTRGMVDGNGNPIGGDKPTGGRGAVADMYLSDLESLQDELATEAEVLDTWYHDRLAILEDGRAQELMGEEAHKEALVRLEEEYSDRVREIEEQRVQAKLVALAGMFGDLSALMRTESKALFNIGKGAAIAEATIDGYQSAVAAWKKGMQIGGPGLAAAFAGASLAKTGALISSIASTSFEGGGGGAGAGPGAVADTGGGDRGAAYYNVSLVGEGPMGTAQVRDLLMMINEDIENGAVIGGITVS